VTQGKGKNEDMYSLPSFSPFIHGRNHVNYEKKRKTNNNSLKKVGHAYRLATKWGLR
jgi:hypothetical protein